MIPQPKIMMNMGVDEGIGRARREEDKDAAVSRVEGPHLRVRRPAILNEALQFRRTLLVDRRPVMLPHHLNITVRCPNIYELVLNADWKEGRSTLLMNSSLLSCFRAGNGSNSRA